MKRVLLATLTFACALGFNPLATAETAGPLPSWNDGTAKQSIIEFVAKVTKEGSPEFVPPAERIATFDNDGTLWTEHPMYTQLAFALDRVKTLAPQHPEWKTTQPFKAVLDNDLDALAASGEEALVELVMATHAGMSTAEFEAVVKDWLQKARHPRFKWPYTELTYQPMLELLEYLRANRFKTYIVSGGGVEFMRPNDRGGLRGPARAGDRLQHQDPVPNEGRQGGADPAARDRLHRRQDRQARRQKQVHR
jgi:hypothetical protein